jgi:hypothetical protein
MGIVSFQKRPAVVLVAPPAGLPKPVREVSAMASLAAFLLTCQASYILTSHGSRATGHDADPFPATLKAILWVESKGDPNAIGDGGRAIGPYQIHKGYWEDATRLLKVDWPYSDARDPVKAAMAVRAYTEHYQRAGRYPATPEIWARIHNGGPRGPEKPATLPYWRKVRAAMSQRQ